MITVTGLPIPNHAAIVLCLNCDTYANICYYFDDENSQKLIFLLTW